HDLARYKILNKGLISISTKSVTCTAALCQARRHQKPQPVSLMLARAVFDRDVLALDEACFFQALAERGDQVCRIGERRAAAKSHYRHRRLLRSPAGGPLLFCGGPRWPQTCAGHCRSRASARLANYD